MSRLEQRAGRRAEWSRPVSAVRFAARHREALGRLGIHTVGDLIMHLPFRHVDLSEIVEIAKVREGTQATVLGVVRGVRLAKPRPRLSIVSVALFDGSGYLFGVWFNQPYVADRLTEGVKAVFSGLVRRVHGRLEMNSPFWEVLEEEEGEEKEAAGEGASEPTRSAGQGPKGLRGFKEPKGPKGPHAGRIIPIHPTTAGLSTTWLRRLAFEALRRWGDVPDPLPPRLRMQRSLVPLAVALSQAHFPDDPRTLQAALRRLAYEELLYLQVALAWRRRRLVDQVAAPPCGWPSALVRRYVQGLPFRLTMDQARALEEIGEDLARAHPMNRLLHGEVGSGKTVVACAALLSAADAGAQGAMMAPTEVLAEQYARKMGPDLDRLGIPWALLLGSTKASQRKRILAQIASGELRIVFGTHALLEEDVRFSRLALVVVDEQHRFGVRQRLALANKGTGSGPSRGESAGPHVLVMTATPIPRTLAMTAYGDLDVSVLKQRPAGSVGARVTTRVLDRRHRRWAYDLVRSEVKAGRQAYVVCPIVDPSDKVRVRSVTREMDRLKDEEFWGLRLGVLHGRLSSAKKEATMDRFARGELDILVATTVIEVGVDVANATVMIVEDAERFGLAQLHQLRGRVGRGRHPGFCLLFADPSTEEGRARMEAMERSSDGFELAELDLAIRGPGEVLGTRQSGMPNLKVARLGRDADLVAVAREDARVVIEADPRLSSDANAAIAAEIQERFAEQLDWLRA